MKHFWALPAVLRPALVLALHHSFSVHDDLLAFPQYEVKFSDDYVSELQAQSRLLNDQADLQVEDGLIQDPPSQVEHYQHSQYDRHEDGRPKEKEKLEYEMMVLGQDRYLCSIPQVTKPSDAQSGNDTLSKAEEERELARANDRGWELLSGMQGNCVYFISGWWSYSFCYEKGVRQFHQLPPSRGVPVFPPVEDPGVEGFMLGTYKKAESIDGAAGAQQEEERWDGEGALELSEHAKKVKSPHGNGELVTRGETRYLVQRLDDGTVCDLTGKPRRIEVQFHCNPQSSDRISLIKETSTCAYLMVIQTPRLCNDVAFLPPQKDQPNAITCSPVLAPEAVEDYELDLAAAKTALHEAADIWQSEANDEYVPEKLVGDIVVGGHNLVPEGKKIEKSAIVGGGKETYVDTVADSEGKILSKEDMERLGLGDPRAVEKLRKELEKIAEGGRWKLDVIDTPRGREYRGIIGDEEDEKDEGSGKKSKEKKKKDGDGEEGEEQEGSQEEYYKEEL